MSYDFLLNTHYLRSESGSTDSWRSDVYGARSSVDSLEYYAQEFNLDEHELREAARNLRRERRGYWADEYWCDQEAEVEHIEGSTSDSIELSVPPLSLDTTPISFPRDPLPNAFTISPVSFNSVTVGTPRRVQSPDHAEFSIPSVSNTGSVRAMRKFESGTKFKEAIDF